MDHRPARSWIWLAALSLAGCAHHYIGWPPTPADIEEINRAATNDDGSTHLALIPVARAGAAAGEANGFQAVRPIVDKPLPEVRQLVSADQPNLTLIDKKGATQTVSLSLLDGFATANRNRSMRRSGVLGALAGLGLSGILALSFLELNGLHEDDPHPAPIAPAIFTVVVGTLVGATVGTIIGYQNPDETFQFGWRR